MQETQVYSLDRESPEGRNGNLGTDTSGLTLRGHLGEEPPSALDEALAHYCVSREVPGSVLKCETVLGTLDATRKVTRLTSFTQGLSGVLGTGLPGLGTEHLPGALCSGD